jgi:hypothetical protein
MYLSKSTETADQHELISILPIHDIDGDPIVDHHFMLNPCPNVDEYGRNYSNMNCTDYSRMVFEADNSTKEDQLENAQIHKEVIAQVTDSGGKSLHCIVIENDPPKPNDPERVEQYKFMWNEVANKIDMGEGSRVEADRACNNP